MSESSKNYRLHCSRISIQYDYKPPYEVKLTVYPNNI